MNHSSSQDDNNDFESNVWNFSEIDETDILFESNTTTSQHVKSHNIYETVH